MLPSFLRILLSLWDSVPFLVIYQVGVIGRLSQKITQGSFDIVSSIDSNTLNLGYISNISCVVLASGLHFI